MMMITTKHYMFLQFYVGTLARENAINSLPISAGWGTKLSILVENQGRINFDILDDYKVSTF